VAALLDMSASKIEKQELDEIAEMIRQAGKRTGK
jgi:hypothetical protein